MKNTLPFIFLFVLLILFARAEEVRDEEILNLDWKTAPHSDNPALTYVLEPASEGSTSSPDLKVTYLGTSYSICTLLIIAPNQLKDRTTHSFNLSGDVRFESGWQGSYMQLWMQNGTWLYHNSWSNGGPIFDFDKPGDWQTFTFAADPQWTRGNLLQMQVQLCLLGPCTLHLRNIKLRQQPLNDSRTVDQPAEAVEQMSWTHDVGGFSEFMGDGATKWSIPYPKVTARYFAIVGEVRYSNAPNLTLSMGLNFVPTKPNEYPRPQFVRTLGDAGPAAKLNGTSNWRPFALPFDLSESERHLGGVGLSLNRPYVPGMQDTWSTAQVRNVRLVQYPTDSTLPTWWASARASSTPPKLSSFTIRITAPDQGPAVFFGPGAEGAPVRFLRGYLFEMRDTSPDASVVFRLGREINTADFQSLVDDWKSYFPSVKVEREGPNPSPESSALRLPRVQATAGKSSFEPKSFILGIAATLATLAAGLILTFVIRYFRRRSNERELRRIASLDG